MRTAKTSEKHKTKCSVCGQSRDNWTSAIFSDSLSGHYSHIFVEYFAESCEDEEIDSDYNIDCSVDSDLNSLQPLCLYDNEIKYKT